MLKSDRWRTDASCHCVKDFSYVKNECRLSSSLVRMSAEKGPRVFWYRKAGRVVDTVGIALLSYILIYITIDIQNIRSHLPYNH